MERAAGRCRIHPSWSPSAGTALQLCLCVRSIEEACVRRSTGGSAPKQMAGGEGAGHKWSNQEGLNCLVLCLFRLVQPASNRTRSSCTRILESINFSAFNRHRLNAEKLIEPIRRRCAARPGPPGIAAPRPSRPSARRQSRRRQGYRPGPTVRTRRQPAAPP